MSQKNCLSILIVRVIQLVIFFNSLVAAASDHLTPSPAGTIQIEIVSTSLESNTFTESDSMYYKKHLGREELDSYSSQLDGLQYSELSNEELDTIRGGDAATLNKTASLYRSVNSTSNAVLTGDKNSSIVGGVAVAGKVLSFSEKRYVTAAGKGISLATDAYTIAGAVQNPTPTNITRATASSLSIVASVSGSAVVSGAANIAGVGASLVIATTGVIASAGPIAPAVSVITAGTPSAMRTLNSVGGAQASTLSSGFSNTMALLSQSQPKVIQTYTSPTSSQSQFALTPSNGAQLTPGFSCAGDCIPGVAAFATPQKIAIPRSIVR